MRQPHPIRSVRRFVIYIVLLSALASVTICAAFFYWRFMGIMTDQLSAESEAALRQVNKSVEAQIDLVDSTFPMFVANPVIQGYLEPISSAYQVSSTSKKLEIERQMSYLLINTYLWRERHISAVYLFDQDDNAYVVTKTNGGNQELEQNRAVQQAIGTEDYSLQILPSPHGDMIYFSRRICSYNDGSYIATIVIDVNESAFREVLGHSYSPEMLVGLSTADGTLLSCQGDREAMLALLADETLWSEPGRVHASGKYLAACQKITNAGIRSCVALEQDRIYAGLNETLRSFFPLFLALAGAILLLALLLSAIITRPIQCMMAGVREISAGNSQVQVPSGMYQELNELAFAMNGMLGKLDEYYQKLYEEELLLKNAQIKSLRAQINPHFLFNVLDTIGWKAQMAGDEEVAEMVVSLGDLLRANIASEDTDEIRLKDELENVKFYLYLQKARFEDRFLTEIRVEGEELLRCVVPRLSLQPLVENAIVHGLEGKAGQGRLSIYAESDGNDLLLTVEDDGLGFEPDKLRPDAPEPAGHHTHIGISNLHRRIALLYGPPWGLTMISAPGKGTKAVMRLPKKYGGNA